MSMSFQQTPPANASDSNLSWHLINAYLLTAVIIILCAILTAYYLAIQLSPTAPNRDLFIHNMPMIFVIGVIGTLLMGLPFWWLSFNRIIHPIATLVDFSEVIRWRGYLSDSERKELTRLARQPAQVGALARTLKAMEQEMTRRITELTTLLETSRIIASSLNIDDVIDNILKQIQTLTGVERCAVLSFNERHNIFQMVASRGMGDYANRYNAGNANPYLPSFRSLQKNKPVQISDTETDLSYAPLRERARREGFRSILAIPIISSQARPAVLILYKNNPYYYGYRELEMMISFANQASIALENAALYQMIDEQLQEQTQRLEAIVESMRDGLILESHSGEILYCNQQAADFIGEMPSSIKGQHSEEILAPHIEPATEVAPNVLEIHHEQARLDLRIHLFDVTDARGCPLGRGQLWQDVSQDKELERMKSALISTVSHELRTPLATIKGYTTTLLANDVQWDKASQNEFLVTISDETDRLTKLVRSLLDMSRIEGRMLNIQKDTHDLNEILLEAIRYYDHDKQSRIRVQAGVLPVVALDTQRIHTVIRNLIDNALKYSPQTNVIDVQTYCGNEEVVLTVRDYGEGIDEAYQPHIFEQFYRIDNGLSREVGGVGIGLAICKGFVEAHNGRIWVENVSKGTLFGISLPL